MSNTVKLIIEISEGRYNEIMNKAKYICPTGLERVIANGTSLDDIKAEIQAKEMMETDIEKQFYNMALDDVIKILDNIGKGDMKVKCNTCKNNDDELSGECYECIKGIFDHYEPQESEEDFPQAKDIEPTIESFVNTMYTVDRICKESEETDADSD